MSEYCKMKWGKKLWPLQNPSADTCSGGGAHLPRRTRPAQAPRGGAGLKQGDSLTPYGGSGLPNLQAKGRKGSSLEKLKKLTQFDIVSCIYYLL